MTPASNVADLAAIRNAREGHRWRRALIQADLSPGVKIVGLCVAEFYINSSTGTAWPSQAAIGEKCGMKPASVKAAVAQLVRAGFLRVQRRGKKLSNVMRLAMPAVAAPIKATPRPETAGEVTAMPVAIRGGVMAMGIASDGDVHRPPYEPKKEPKIKKEPKNNTDRPPLELSPYATANPVVDGMGSNPKIADSDSADRPIRRGGDDAAARIFIGRAGAELLGVTRLPSGEWADRGVLRALPPQVLAELVAQNRAGKLMLSDVADAVQRFIPPLIGLAA